MPATLEQVEAALDRGEGGHVWMPMFMTSGQIKNFWRCRRNGKTKTWKRSPEHWEIPIKFGLKTCGKIYAESICWSVTEGSLSKFYIAISKRNPMEYLNKTQFEIMILEKADG